MKIWKKYEKYLLTGEWHIHTNYTDGSNTVDEISQYALEKGIPLIAFTEHVRRHMDYNFEDFMEDIDRAREKYPQLIILSGVEAKVLPDGSLDVDENIIKEVDYPIFAYHSFPDDIEVYMRTLSVVVKNEYVNTWAHPGLFLLKRGYGVRDIDIVRILREMRENDVLLEINYKYNLPFAEWLTKAKEMGVELVKGGDIHSIQDLKRRVKMRKYLNKGKPY